MISVGVDVAKGKSTICVLKPYGEVLMKPKDYRHTQSDLKVFTDSLKGLNEEVHVIMEATGSYHLPIAEFLKEQGYPVRIINPLEMKRYRCQGIRNPKTDSIDAIMIAQYGIDFWHRPIIDIHTEELRAELKMLGMQYFSVMKSRQDRSLALINILDRTMPGICGILDDFNKDTGRDKQGDFVYEYCHADMITKYSKNKFCERYKSWTKKKGYIFSEKEAGQLYSIAKDSIPTLKMSENTIMVVRNAVKILQEVDASLYDILTQMNELAKQLPEYETVMSMKGVGRSIGPRLMAEI